MTTLLELFIKSPEYFEDKKLKQIISMTGNGKLSDGSETSNQLREYLRELKPAALERYIIECLEQDPSFVNSGYAFQDLVNIVGEKLGFRVEHGLYKGLPKRVGYDGIWFSNSGHSFVVETKTTDVYSIKLDSISTYREKLIQEGKFSRDESSILIVVGRQDTGGLESLILGSHEENNMRVVSAESLLLMMTMKMEIGDESTTLKMHEILKPHDYIRVDRLIEIMFSTAKDIMEEDEIEENIQKEAEEDLEAIDKQHHAKFHEECIDRIEDHIGTRLMKQGKCKYSSRNDTKRIVCIVSRKYGSDNAFRYWYAFRPYQVQYLEDTEESYVLLGCGNSERLLLIPFSEFAPLLTKMDRTEKGSRHWWHVRVFEENGKMMIGQPAKSKSEDITRFLITFPS